MSLFKSTPRGRTPRHFSRNGQFRKVIIIEQPAPRLPDFMKRLDLLCNRFDRHPLPCKMKFIGESTSDSGQPMAVYACPHPGCGWREGWVVDRHTHRPRRLWAGFHNPHHGR